jgi:hypothetical protein
MKKKMESVESSKKIYENKEVIKEINKHEI